MNTPTEEDSLREKIANACMNHDILVTQRGSYQELFINDLITLIQSSNQEAYRQGGIEALEFVEGIMTDHDLRELDRVTLQTLRIKIRALTTKADTKEGEK